MREGACGCIVEIATSDTIKIIVWLASGAGANAAGWNLRAVHGGDFGADWPIAVVWWFAPPSARVLAVIIAAFLVLLAACVLLLPSGLVSRDTTLGDLNPEQRANAVNSARTTLVQALVGLAALAGIFVGWQQLQIDRDQSRTDRQQLTAQLTLTRQGQVAERFTRAVDQLGSARLEQRLGGIYGLERIARDSSGGDIRLDDRFQGQWS
jgi:hypothetical protein